jgi:hypothetical protein
MGGLALILRRLVDGRIDLYDQVAACGLHHAVVVLRSGTGRSYNPLRPRDLTRNGISLADADVIYIYALDLPERPAALKPHFPERGFFVYRRGLHAAKGTLSPL